MIKYLKLWIRKQFCKHTVYVFVRNIGGDEQMYRYVKGGGLARSEHVCDDCGDFIYRSDRY